MDLLKEAKNVVDFATYYPLLNKATIDNDTPTPGYLFEEIIKLSHQSSGHRQHLVDFLLSRLQISTWPGKQKVIRILHQVCSRGHYGVRIYLRGRDGELRKAASAGGPPDPVLANTPQLFLSSAIQELLTLLFDPKIMREDELYLTGTTNIDGSKSTLEQSGIGQGYGSSAPKGKYEGFGSSPINRGDNLVSQVRDIVERVMTPSGDSKRVGLEFLQGEKGDYQPLSLPSLGSSMSGPVQSAFQPHLPILTKSQSSKYRAHKTGRAGGGWDSDEETTEAPSSPFSSELEVSIDPSDNHSGGEQMAGASEDEFIASFLHPRNMWPLDHDQLIKTCQECTGFNLNILLEKISLKFTVLGGSKIPDGTHGSDSSESRQYAELLASQTSSSKEVLPQSVNFATSRLLILLLLIEFGMHYDIFAPSLINNTLGKTLQNIQENDNLDSTVRIKAKKLSLIIHKFV